MGRPSRNLLNTLKRFVISHIVQMFPHGKGCELSLKFEASLLDIAQKNEKVHFPEPKVLFLQLAFWLDIVWHYWISLWIFSIDQFWLGRTWWTSRGEFTGCSPSLSTGSRWKVNSFETSQATGSRMVCRWGCKYQLRFRNITLRGNGF